MKAAMGKNLTKRWSNFNHRLSFSPRGRFDGRDFSSKSLISTHRLIAGGSVEIGNPLAIAKAAGRERQKILGASEMTIEKKSLISALKTTMKANAVKEDTGNATISSPAQVLPGLKSPGLKGAGSKGPGSKGPGSKGPGSKGPGSKGPGSKGPGSKGPGSKGPGSKGPGSKGPGQKGLARAW